MPFNLLCQTDDVVLLEDAARLDEAALGLITEMIERHENPFSQAHRPQCIQYAVVQKQIDERNIATAVLMTQNFWLGKRGKGGKRRSKSDGSDESDVTSEDEAVEVAEEAGTQEMVKTSALLIPYVAA